MLIRRAAPRPAGTAAAGTATAGPAAPRSGLAGVVIVLVALAASFCVLLRSATTRAFRTTFATRRLRSGLTRTAGTSAFAVLSCHFKVSLLIVSANCGRDFMLGQHRCLINRNMPRSRVGFFSTNVRKICVAAGRAGRKVPRLVQPNSLECTSFLWDDKMYYEDLDGDLAGRLAQRRVRSHAILQWRITSGSMRSAAQIR